MIAVARSRVIQPVRAKVVPAEPITNNELGRLMADLQSPDHVALAGIVNLHVEHLNGRINEVRTDLKDGLKDTHTEIKALGDKIDAAQSQRTEALKVVRDPWYVRPSVHLAIICGVLAIILLAQAIGQANVGKVIDRVTPTATLQGG